MQRRRGSVFDANTVASSRQPEINEALLQTVARFLRELQDNPTDSE